MLCTRGGLAEARVAFGIDLSHHQDPATLPWNSFEGKVDFVICRAGYGAETRDRQVDEHVRRARAIGAKVGLYLFYRPSQSVDAQWDLLRGVADDVKLGPGDIVPALDIEHDPLPQPGQDVTPDWSSPCQDLTSRIVGHFGDALVYITQREYEMLGRPAWVLDRPLWVAHYTSAASPATPGQARATIWQYRVGPFDPSGPGGFFQSDRALDQNRTLSELPLIRSLPDAGLDELRDAAALRFM
jgi:lysozyme